MNRLYFSFLFFFLNLIISVSKCQEITCMPNAVCYPQLQLESKATVMIIIRNAVTNQSYQGSGVILNNEKNDGKQYLLTDFHVIDVDNTGTLTQPDLDALQTVKIYFNYKRNTCSDYYSALDYTSTPFVVGATLRARHDVEGLSGCGDVGFKQCHGNDFALLELSQNIPIQYVSFAGWKANDLPGSLDMLSYGATNPLKYSHFDQVFDVVALAQSIWGVHNDIGSLVDGSSGGPAFDQNKVVGLADAAFLNDPNCNGALLQKKFLSKFEYMYNKSTDPALNLKSWLAPTSNILELNSLDPLLYLQSSTSLCYGSSVTFSLPNLPQYAAGSTSFSITAGLKITSQTFNSVTVTSTSPSLNENDFVTVSIGASNPVVKKLSVYVYNGSPIGTGYYVNTFNNSQNPLGYYPGILNSACTGYYINTHIQYTGSIPIKWVKVSSTSTVNYSQNGNDISFYLFGVGQTVVFQASATNACGTTSTALFGWQASNCTSGGGGGCGNILVSPNPTTSNTISVIVPNVPPPCGLINTNSIQVNSASIDSTNRAFNSALYISKVKIYNNTGILKKTINLQGAKQININLSGLNFGLYYLDIETTNGYVEHKLIEVN